MGPAWAQDVTCHAIAIKKYVVGANATSNSVNNLLTKHGASLERQDNYLPNLDEKISNNKDNIDKVQRLAWQESKESSNIANLNHSPVEVKHHQVVAYLHLLPIEEVTEIHNFGTLDEFGLPSEEEMPPAVCTIIPQEQLQWLTVAQQDAALALFEKYKDIFAKDDFDLGCAQNTLHHIDTDEECPIRLCPI
ncbi:hypothetical protein DSO57_1029474 [Entomophthora muscae]|uniref:Uncharacterized protein n=1 Tax=Entomophthora muscae TaxID=34485 RepID=A0ACC2SQK7_9FUNG|nr:hypothetical protein DSO57_1029474 [Entomophthora muscae]